MKAEERKALETNALAQELGKALDTIKQGPSRSTTIYLVVGLAIVLGVLLFRWFWRSSEEADSRRWVTLDGVIFPEQLSAVLAEPDMEGKMQGRLAKFKEARLKLTQGIRDLGANPSLGQKHIEEGTKLYEQLIDAASRTPLLHQEALWGSAKGNESLGNLDKAKDYYTRLKKGYPASSMGKDAEKQLERLDSDAGKRDINALMKEFAPPR
jgi:hypothetical protein